MNRSASSMLGIKGVATQQVAYWESVFRRFLDTPEWAAELARRHGIRKFMGAAAMKKYMDDEYPEVRAFLAELELAKK